MTRQRVSYRSSLKRFKPVLSDNLYSASVNLHIVNLRHSGFNGQAGSGPFGNYLRKYGARSAFGGIGRWSMATVGSLDTNSLVDGKAVLLRHCQSPLF